MSAQISAGGTYACERAIGLIYDELDGWPLDTREVNFVKLHLDGCHTCTVESTAIREEDEFFTKINWEGDDSEDWDPDWDDDEDADASGGGGEPIRIPTTRPAQEGETPDTYSSGANNGLDDDYEDDGATAEGGDTSVSSGEADDDAQPGRGGPGHASGQQMSPDTEFDDSDDAEEMAAISEAAEEAEQEARREAARKAADKLSDEDLASLDETPTMDDGLLPECAADGVDKAAASGGVKKTDQLEKEAEEIVRNSEGVQDAGKRGKVAVYRSTRGLTRKSQYQTRPGTSSSSAAVIRNAIMRSRTGHTDIEAHQSRGRLDSKGIYRIAQHDPRLFKRRHAPSPPEYLVWVMVDVSGSMQGDSVAQVAEVARAMAEATTGTPNVRMAIWAWSDPFLSSQKYRSAASAGVAKVWETGMPTSEIERIVDLPMGGTPDSTVMAWAWRALLQEKRGDEIPVILFCSDGQGDNRGMMDEIVSARKHGVLVRSVAIGYSVRQPYQEAVYGRGNYVPWMGTMFETARPLAAVLGKLATARV